MSGLFLVAESSGDLIFAPKIFFCAGIGLKWGVFLPFMGPRLRLIFLSIFDEMFLQEVEDLFF
jgi:hypothetical protein